jgi:ACS family hexuronate transporter-like MFS transporter
VWGIAGVGAGLGGAVFQALSGYALQELSHHFNYFIAYNTVFIGYGAMALLGMVIMVFLTGPLTPDKALDNYSIGLSGHT